MNSKLSKERLNSIIEDCFNVEFDNNVFPPNVFDILNNTSARSGVSISFLLPPLIASLGHCMGTSSINSHEECTQTEGFVFYTVLLGLPSTGKTAAMKICQKAFRMREQIQNTKFEESTIGNAGTAEAIIELLNKIGCIISFFDESSAFFGSSASLGRYGNGCGSVFDRSVFLELFNADDVYIRDLKCTRTRVIKPRLNICTLEHPSNFIRMINEERDNFEDGLMQRFLMACPKPLLQSVKTNLKSPKPKISLIKILYLIGELHKTPRQYYLSESAFDAYNEFYSDYRILVDKCKIADGFLSAMFGKAATILLRLTGILKALKTSVRFLEGFDEFQGSPKKESNFLEAEFVSWVEANISIMANCQGTFVVDDLTVTEAARLLEYFNIHRLKLAGYAVTSKSLGIDIVLELIKKTNSSIRESVVS